MRIRVGEQDFTVTPTQGIVLAGTGHRPDKLGGYSEATDSKLHALACKVLLECGPARVITGMAIGWDMALAAACVEGKIPFDAYIPFRGQENRWPGPTQERYRALLAKARYVNVSWETPDLSAFDRRNRDMIRACEIVLALWNGGNRGGTANAVRDSESVRREIWNVWPMWEEMVLAPPSTWVAPGAPGPV